MQEPISLPAPQPFPFPPYPLSRTATQSPCPFLGNLLQHRERGSYPHFTGGACLGEAGIVTRGPGPVLAPLWNRVLGHPRAWQNQGGRAEQSQARPHPRLLQSEPRPLRGQRPHWRHLIFSHKPSDVGWGPRAEPARAECWGGGGRGAGARGGARGRLPQRGSLCPALWGSAARRLRTAPRARPRRSAGRRISEPAGERLKSWR